MLDTQLVAFLEATPNEKYVYCSTDNCVAAQFNRSIGRDYPLPKALSGAAMDKPTTFDGKLEKAAREAPWNFGACLGRYRQLEDA